MGSEILERGRVEPGRTAVRAEIVEPAEPAVSPAVERLHALVRKGYVPEIGSGTATDLIVLRHVGRAPDLVLRADGVVEGFEGRVPRFKKDVEPPPAFGNRLAEQLRFLKFLDSVPRATLWDRTRRFRHKFVYLPLAFALLVALHILITTIVMGG